MPGVMETDSTIPDSPPAPAGEPEDSGVLEECIMAPGRVREMVALFSEVAARQSLRRSLRRNKEQQRSSRGKGSEPSLVSRNGQHSSASKRTLNSQENLSPVQHQPVASALPAGTVASQATAVEQPLVGDPSLDDSLDTTPKTPSYLKLSCSVSGYNRYNKYGSPKEQASENRIRVLTADHGADQSGSDLDSESHPATCEPGLTNGCDTTDNASALIHGAPVIANGRTVKESSHSEVSHVNSLPAVNGGNHNVVLQNTGLDVSQTSAEFQLDLEEIEKPSSVTPASVTSPDTPAKDGHYYMGVMQQEEQRITALCQKTEPELNQKLPDEVSGKIRAAIGKANLLTTKKFKQFRGLCDKNNTQSADEPFPTTTTDLAGFWDLVLLQVDDINAKFDEIAQMKSQGWQVQNSPVRNSQAKVGSKTKSPRAKSGGVNAQRSARSAEMARQREEARQRLLAAKKAGRVKRISESDKDEVQIYVA